MAEQRDKDSDADADLIDCSRWVGRRRSADDNVVAVWSTIMYVAVTAFRTL